MSQGEDDPEKEEKKKKAEINKDLRASLGPYLCCWGPHHVKDLPGIHVY